MGYRDTNMTSSFQAKVTLPAIVSMRIPYAEGMFLNATSGPMLNQAQKPNSKECLLPSIAAQRRIPSPEK